MLYSNEPVLKQKNLGRPDPISQVLFKSYMCKVNPKADNPSAIYRFEVLVILWWTSLQSYNKMRLTPKGYPVKQEPYLDYLISSENISLTKCRTSHYWQRNGQMMLHNGNLLSFWFRPLIFHLTSFIFKCVWIGGNYYFLGGKKCI